VREFEKRGSERERESEMMGVHVREYVSGRERETDRESTFVFLFVFLLLLCV